MKSCYASVCLLNENSNDRGRRVFNIPARFIVFLLLICIGTNYSNAQTIVTKQLYLSDPAQALDRIDPVSTADATTASTWNLSPTPPGIAVANTTTGSSDNPGSTIFTVSHTTGIGANRLMLVGISQKNKLVTSVTYGGTPLTLVGERITSTNARMHIYALVNPNSGTANVVVNLSANPDKGIVVGVVTFTGVNQTTPLGSFASAYAKSNTVSTTVASAAGELVFDVATFRNTTMTSDAGQSALYNINSGGEVKGGGASTKAGASSVTMTWTGASSQDWAVGAVPIKPCGVVNSTTFTQAPALCSELTIKAGNTITVTNYVTIVSGIMPANPNITALLRYGATDIISLTNPTYNNVSGLLTWTGTLGADVTVPAGQAIALDVTTAQSGVVFNINFDSQTKPSRIDLPVSTFINVNSIDLYTAAYPGGIVVNNSVGGTTKYIRATVSDPFGVNDITGLNFTITPVGSSVAGTSVATAGCVRTYEYVWSIPVSAGSYLISGTAREGYENTVTHTKNINVDVCVDCPPSAVNDSASGPGGVPLIVDVLANDSDPNNNINTASLSILTQPSNGSALLSNGKIVYIPNGTFSGRDTIIYQVCDLTTPTPLCATASVFVTIDLTITNPCTQVANTHTYYIPYPEQEAYTALAASASQAIPSSNIRTIISLKIPYPGMMVTWDEWEDGYEADINNPVQSTTKVWGDGNIYNGIAPGYPNDIIPAGGSIVLDNTMPANPRNAANIFYDGKDKIVSSGQIAMTQVCGEPTWMPVQAIKTNITSTYDFGQSFIIPFGQNFNSKDFAYTALFVRASQNNTTVNIDKDNNGTFETTVVLNEGDSYLVNGGVLTGAIVTSDKPVGVEVNSGGVDNFSIRNAPIFPATWYSHTYYTPVPTSDVAGDITKDTSVVMFYNSLNRALTINWSSGIPSSGTINLPAKSAVRFPLAYSTTAAYKFVNPTGESFTAIEIVDSYTPGGGGNSGSTYDWAFNLISEAKLTDFATLAWAPGSLDGTRNDNPIWITPDVNTTLYVKYNGDITSGPGTSPCGLKFDVSYSLNALQYLKIKDPNDNDQSGMAIYTCNGAKIAAVYGEDPATALAASPSWDVGATIQPFCKEKMIFARNDKALTFPNQPVTISVLNNDFGFLATLNPSSLHNSGLLQPSNGTVSINANGTILYTPNTGFVGLDTFQYQICSTPSPVVCDIATVYVQISACPSGANENIITGQVFFDVTKDGINNDGGTGFSSAKVYLYTDGNCNGITDANELTDSVTVDNSGMYQFVKQPVKTVKDDFDGTGGTSTCASGSDGNTPWLTNWVDSGDPSVGFCVTPAQSAGNTDVEIVVDGAFGYALRLDHANTSASRTLNLSGATKAFITFSYRKATTSLNTGEDVLVQASKNGTSYTTIFTISGNGTVDTSYVTVHNLDITSFESGITYIRFLTNANLDEGDHVFIDNISIQFLKYNQCYITRLDPASVPVDHYATTTTQKTMTITSGSSCFSQFDFGVARNSIQVSGKVYNDPNGLKNNQVNGTGIGTVNGTDLYAYLINASGKVAHKSSLSGSGDFLFSQADVNTTYTLRISTSDVAQFNDAPATANLPNPWVSVGEEYGSNNEAGTGVKTGTSTSSIQVITGLTSVSGLKVGLNRKPDSDDKFSTIPEPYLNTFVTLNGVGVNPPLLSGIDAEDCPGGSNLNSRDVIIDAIPFNAELYYNNSLVTNNQVINNLNPDKLTIKFTNQTIGDTSVYFYYSFVDQADVKDPAPARYTIMWFSPLSANGLSLTANLIENNTILKWTTLTEQNTSHFVMERSIDNVNFSPISNHIKAAGESVRKSEYQMTDNIESLLHNSIIYYRVKLIDLDGRIKYSNVAPVRLIKSVGISTWPNPFQSSVNININTPASQTLTIKLSDISYKILRSYTRKVTKGNNQITFNGLDQLPAGMYLIEIRDQANNILATEKLVKNK